MEKPIVNPQIPYSGAIPTGQQQGKMVRIQGAVPQHADRFNVNLQTGPNSKPKDDTGLHLSVRLKQGYIARNSYQGGSWGDEQGSGRLPIGPGQQFEIIILSDAEDFKVQCHQRLWRRVMWLVRRLQMYKLEVALELLKALHLVRVMVHHLVKVMGPHLVKVMGPHLVKVMALHRKVMDLHHRVMDHHKVMDPHLKDTVQHHLQG
ncbi:Gal-bind lectin domain containing protein [Asbolus verrucosus]|uniref:Galectin n=1 Tax=Asbolus verrucosus TaxID=1661398 RepID=A0A482WAJ6_ASBVE|nr:Gal-bind lectin domain containing protein [Asbolus verrucosus]